MTGPGSPGYVIVPSAMAWLRSTSSPIGPFDHVTATVPAMRTRLTELLDIEHPVMLAGMGGVSYHRLVAAVSEAGGIGTFGASTMAVDELPREIAALKELTDKPFGVDLLTVLPGEVEAGIQAVIDGGARI